MSASKSEKLKDHIAPLLSAMRDFSDQTVQEQLEKILVPECQIKMCFPYGTIKGGLYVVPKYFSAPFIVPKGKHILI